MRIVFLLSIIAILSCQSTENTNGYNDKPIDDQLSKYFPAPFRPAETYEINNREIFNVNYLNELISIHSDLYEKRNLKKAYQKTLELEVGWKDKNINPWYKKRLTLDNSFYHLRERNYPLAKAQAQLILQQDSIVDTLLQVDALTILADLDFRSEKFDEALELLGEAEELLENQNNKFERLQTIKIIEALTYANAKSIEAEISLAELKAICANKSNCLGEYYRIKGIYHYLKKDSLLIIPTFLASIESFEKADKPFMYSYTNVHYELSNSLHIQKRFEESLYHAQRAYNLYNENEDNKDNIYNVTLLAGIAEVKAKQAIFEKNTNLAIEAFNLYNESLQKQKEQAKNNFESFLYNHYYHSYNYTYLIELSNFLYDQTQDNQWLNSMLTYMSGYKSSLLYKESLLNQIYKSSPKDDKTLTTFFETNRELEEIIHRENTSTKLDPKLASDKLQLLKKQEKLVNDIKQRYPDIGEQLQETNDIDIEAVLEKSKNDEKAYVLFHPGSSIYSHNLYAISLYKGNLKQYFIANTKLLQTKIRQLFEWHSSKDDNLFPEPIEYASLSNQIYNTLFQEIFEDIKDADHIQIFPENYLSTIPFDALVRTLPSKDSVSFRSLDYLLHHTDIFYGFIFNPTKRKIKKENKEYVLGIAWSDSQTILNQKNPIVPELPGSSKEMDYLLQAYPKKDHKTVIFKGKQATKANFLKYANKSKVIHLSVHGEADSLSRNNSRLLFRNGNDIDYYFAYELLFSGISPDLLILSACESGSGKFEESEGMFSIARGFYGSGAEKIFSAIWSIDDRISNIIIREYINNVNLKSISQLKNNYLKQSEDYLEPKYWVPFIILE